MRRGMTSSSGLHGVPTVAARRATSSLAVAQDAPMRRVRFAPSPTGTLHIGNALSAVANRRFGDWLLLRIDDTDATRNVPGGEEAILRDLGVARASEWDEGPVRQSERAERYREAAEQLGVTRFDGDHARPRGRLRHLPARHRRRRRRLRDHPCDPRQRPPAERADPPAAARGARDASRREYVHHGLILGDDGKKLSKRAEGATVASLREAGIPGRGRARVPRGARPARGTTCISTCHGSGRLAIEAIEALSGEELARRAARTRSTCR